MDSEEFDKLMKELSKTPPPSFFQWRGDWIAEKEKYIPLEQDEQGIYGYKTLIRVPASPWFWSPNGFHHAEWVNNCLTAHASPYGNDNYGIYATKSLEELQKWYEAYESELRMGYAFTQNSSLVLSKVKIRAWGAIVEHSLGFRAEHAEIVEVYDGHR